MWTSPPCNLVRIAFLAKKSKRAKIYTLQFTPLFCCLFAFARRAATTRYALFSHCNHTAACSQIHDALVGLHWMHLTGLIDAAFQLPRHKQVTMDWSAPGETLPAGSSALLNLRPLGMMRSAQTIKQRSVQRMRSKTRKAGLQLVESLNIMQ